ncbi:MAG: PD40 domain-containing protein [Verrucomicrobiales bacterium]|nr:PD40 domain-containing protein [Verrucomicrobiales bacterium]
MFCLILACGLSPLVAGISSTSAEALPEIIFAVRTPKGPHWYENFGHQITDPARTCYGSAGRLCRLDPGTGALRVLLDDPDGSVRDPQVHYDGRRILFSYRPGGSPYHHLYEIDADGDNLRRLTDGPFDDLEPTFLPDGGIGFCSSRCNRFVPCWYVQVATLYRCEADGSGIRPLSSNIEQDNTPWPLPDGRVVYTRWEYVDRSREHFHHLWVMNPDGTGQMTLYGNLFAGDVFLDAKPIPGTTKLVMVNSPAHGRQEHEGRIAVVRTDLGPDDPEAQRILTSGVTFRDPYPLSEDAFLVAQEDRLLLMDGAGETRELLRLSGELAKGGTWVHEPRPLLARPREPVIPARSDLAAEHGTLTVMDVYRGRNMEGIERGAIKQLLILENLPKPVNYTGSMDPVSYGGSYTINRVLGTVPVEPDGSARFNVPPLRRLQLVALDANDFSVKRMLSFLTVMPGETTACIGCHEDRTATEIVPANVLALRKPPSAITPIPGTPEICDYPRDIQPIWDRHCVECHDEATYAGNALLTGDQGPMFTHSYFTLSARLQVADGRDLAHGNYPPYRIGSAASPLMAKLDGSHHDVTLSPGELRLVKLWIDAGATFPGTYAALASGMIGPYAELQYGTRPNMDYLSWPGLKAAHEAMQRRCASCHAGDLQLPSSPADNLGLRLHHLAYGDGTPRFWDPPWLKTYGDGSLRPGSGEWMKAFADPRLRFSRNILYNLSHPERSLQLLAPLATASGGHATCGEVFGSRDDPDYQRLLDGIREAQAYLGRIKRFNMPGFRPEPEYVREMQRYGILPADLPQDAPIDVYDTDRRYWRSFWHHPRDTDQWAHSLSQ